MATAFSITSLMYIYLTFFTGATSEQRIHDLLSGVGVGIVEGKIKNFSRKTLSNTKSLVTEEFFTIDSITFTYQGALLERFNQFSETKNEMFRNDVQVRITYGKNDLQILKVEIAE